MSHLATQIRRIAGATAIAAGLAFTANVTPVAAQALVQLDAPAIVTSIGQSLDAFSVQLAVKRAGVEPDYDNHIDAAHMDADHVVPAHVRAEAPEPSAAHGTDTQAVPLQDCPA